MFPNLFRHLVIICCYEVIQNNMANLKFVNQKSDIRTTTYVLENDRCRIKIFYWSQQKEGGPETEFKSICRLLGRSPAGALPYRGCRALGRYSPSYMNYLLPSGCAISFDLDQIVSASFPNSHIIPLSISHTTNCDESKFLWLLGSKRVVSAHRGNSDRRV